jgi:hypothetical protein
MHKTHQFYVLRSGSGGQQVHRLLSEIVEIEWNRFQIEMARLDPRNV